MIARHSEDETRWRARAPLVAALVVAVGAAASIVPLRIASCGPDPENLWCYTEPFFGAWPLWNLVGGAIVGLVVGLRRGVLIVVVANLIGYVVFGMLDPLESTYPFDFSYAITLFLLGGIPALVGLAAGALVRTLARLPRRSHSRP